MKWILCFFGHKWDYYPGTNVSPIRFDERDCQRCSKSEYYVPRKHDWFPQRKPDRTGQMKW